MEMTWSKWFRCESSFALLLVPNQPGVFALAEEVMEPGLQSRRMLAVFAVDETENLASAMSRLFALGSPLREKLAGANCFARYAVVADADQRNAAATALRKWLEFQRETAAQIFDKPVAAPAIETEAEEEEREIKTVAERAVDRVASATEYAGVFRVRT